MSVDFALPPMFGAASNIRTFKEGSEVSRLCAVTNPDSPQPTITQWYEDVGVVEAMQKN